ncbi:MAG: hypothetical protein Q4B64_00695 [Spirochaetales bacterium]|nr:hypothetical protein [Spirochaetales bacterium]
MKIFKGLFFTVAAFFIFSCTQLNLKNPVGAVNVSLPSSSRMIIEEGQTVNSFEKINYLISLYSSSGALVDKKMALEGSSVTFPDVAEGSYVVKAFCNTTSNGKEECIAAGFKSAEVKGGEVTPVIIELSYNRPDKIDVNRSSIRYTGKTEFSSENEMAAYVSDNFKDFLSAEIVFTNGWSETVVDADRFFVEKNQVSQIPGGTFATGGTGGATEVIVSGGKDPCQFKVTLSLNENITKELIVTLYVVKELLNNDPIVIPDLTVGLSEDNPCLTPDDFTIAIVKVPENGTIYLKGDYNSDKQTYDLEFKRALPITKNITIKSVVDNLRVIRGDKEAYLVISSGITLNINESSSDKKIVFTDSVNGCTLNYMYGSEGNIVVYNAVFTNISCGAILANDVKLTGCAFSSISSTYGAIHVMSERTATIESCTFSGNTTSRTEAGDYGDVYLAKDETSSLTITGQVESDINVFINNSNYKNPNILIGSKPEDFTGDVKIHIGGVVPAQSGESLVLLKKAWQGDGDINYMISYCDFKVGEDYYQTMGDSEKLTFETINLKK